MANMREVRTVTSALLGPSITGEAAAPASPMGIDLPSTAIYLRDFELIFSFAKNRLVPSFLYLLLSPTTTPIHLTILWLSLVAVLMNAFLMLCFFLFFDGPCFISPWKQNSSRNWVSEQNLRHCCFFLVACWFPDLLFANPYPIPFLNQHSQDIKASTRGTETANPFFLPPRFRWRSAFY